MKRLSVLIASTVVILFLSGCIKTSTYHVPRSDQTLLGNRGIVQGEVPPTEAGQERTRTITAIDIELPPSRTYKEKKSDEEGERSTQKTAKVQEKVMTEEELLGMPGAEEESPAEATKTLTQKAVVRVKSKAEVEVQRYKVQTGDTLEKIAQKFYGKASKWPVVFEANKDIIPEPSKIYPGQEIIIPALAEEKKEEIIQQTK